MRCAEDQSNCRLPTVAAAAAICPAPACLGAGAGLGGPWSLLELGGLLALSPAELGDHSTGGSATEHAKAAALAACDQPLAPRRPACSRVGGACVGRLATHARALNRRVTGTCCVAYHHIRQLAAVLEQASPPAHALFVWRRTDWSAYRCWRRQGRVGVGRRTPQPATLEPAEPNIPIILGRVSRGVCSVVAPTPRNETDGR